MPDKKIIDNVNPCPFCFNDATTIAEEFICGIQTKCTLRCYVCGFTLIERTTKKAVKKWNRRTNNAR